MATAAKAFYGHITHNPRVLGGRACIDDTRIRVLDIVQLLHEGRKPEEMLDVFAVPLTLAQVHAHEAEVGGGDVGELPADTAVLVLPLTRAA